MAESLDVEIAHKRDLRASFWAGFLFWWVGVIVGTILARREGFYKAVKGMMCSFVVALIVAGGFGWYAFVVRQDAHQESLRLPPAKAQVRRVTEAFAKECAGQATRPRTLSKVSAIVNCVDPWGNELKLVTKDRRSVIVSAGPDGSFDTNDDIFGEPVQKGASPAVAAERE